MSFSSSWAVIRTIKIVMLVNSACLKINMREWFSALRILWLTIRRKIGIWSNRTTTSIVNWSHCSNFCKKWRRWTVWTHWRNNTEGWHNSSYYRGKPTTTKNRKRAINRNRRKEQEGMVKYQNSRRVSSKMNGLSCWETLKRSKCDSLDYNKYYSDNNEGLLLY